MKNYRTKLLAGIFTFAIGVTAFYLASKLKPEIFEVFYTNTAIEETSLPEIKEVELSERIEIRFVGFSRNEEYNYDLAEFEVTNNTSQNAYYYSYSKESYPFPKLKRNGSIVLETLGHCGTGIEQQTLKSGETVTFGVPKSEITYEFANDKRGETDQPTQIGFPFQFGEDGFFQSQNQEQTYFWSEEIKFPTY